MGNLHNISGWIDQHTSMLRRQSGLLGSFCNLFGKVHPGTDPQGI
jgi:hypothetical protein